MDMERVIKDMFIFENSDISYLNKILLDNDNNLKVVDYEEIKDIPQEQISQFCVQNGYYCIPTTELIDFLLKEISTDKTIEIGSGNGTICKVLGIIGTDNFMQQQLKYKVEYEKLKQTIVPYGKHVEKLNAIDAVNKYKPTIVIGAWCTHKYNPNEHWRGGNEIGIDEYKILRKVKKYIHIGNDKVHVNKPILAFPHKIIHKEWLVSRSMSKDKNVIYIWSK